MARSNKTGNEYPAFWLGVGAFTVGLGAAVLSGSPVAQADTGHAGPHNGGGGASTAADLKRPSRSVPGAATGIVRPQPKSTVHAVAEDPTAVRSISSIRLPPAAGPGTGLTARPDPLVAPSGARSVVSPTPLKTLATQLWSGLHYGLSVPAPISTALEGVYRRLTAVVVNRPPTANPVQIGPNPGGQVIGTIGAVDPNGDSLRYAVTDGPDYGTVAVTANGTYTYTPGAGLALAGGTDRFTVQVKDTGLHLFGAPGTISVPVTVTVGSSATGAIGLGGEPFEVVLGRDGRTAYVTDIANNRVSVIDTATGCGVASIPVGRSPFGIALAPNGLAYVVNSADNTVSVINTATNRVIGSPIRVGNSPTSVALNATGSLAYVTNSNDDTLSVISTATAKVVATMATGDSPFGLAVAGTRVYVTNEGDNTVSVFDTTSNRVIATVAVGENPTGIVFADGKVVVTNSGTTTISGAIPGSVSVIDATTNTVLGTAIPVGGTPTDVAISADGRLAYVSDLTSGTVSTIDLASGTLVGDPLAGPAGAAGIAVDASGRAWVAGAYDGSLTPLTGQVDSAVSIPVSGETSAAGAAGASNKWTKGFTVYNFTKNSLTLAEFLGTDRPDPSGYPLEGTVIPPGGSLHFEVLAPVFAHEDVQVVLTAADGTKWRVTMRTRIFGEYAIGGAKADANGNFDYIGAWADTDWDGSDLRLLDPRGTKVTLSGLDPEAAKLLSEACTNGSVVCNFKATTTPKGDWTDWAAPSTPGASNVLVNGTNVAQKKTIKWSVSESTKTSVETSIKFSYTIIEKVFSAELNAKIGREWAKTSNYEESTELNAPPNTQVALTTRSPVWTVTGDATIRYGNTTIVITGMTLQVPDTRRGVETRLSQSPVSTS